ncbi:murein transglycosylase [Skermanella stibiiresistens SB22]|uniref:Murein transglycosylase n=1 Tax=Skermanella stibiiresistens SB22 TaxID=1385369 RepID=W9H900_9PROT|nr:lytic murein transglycosylase [Skermanella stibiiresistens]EWY42740.1 murein transglycosylase [Skermanella stibiiresistens SB22]
MGLKTSHIMILAAAVVAAAGCSSAGGEPLPIPGTKPPPGAADQSAPLTPDPMAQEADFATWLAGFRSEARAAGIKQATLDGSLSGLRVLPEVLASDSSQPEFTRPVWAYLDSALNDTRVNRGRDQLGVQRGLLAGVENDYGVPAEVVVAIWAMESNFGQNMGSYNVVEALATLAWHGRRADFWREQLIEALRIIDRGDAPGGRLVGSWAGAMGHTQFIPTTYASHAVDRDGDGRRDLWTSLPDVFGSTAGYLHDVGWRPGEAWGAEAVLPPGFDYEQADMSVRKPIAEWRRLGVRQASGTRPLPDQADASILLPAGNRGAAFLVMNNFRSILRYNNSSSYALAISYLSDRMAGRPGIQGGWPRDERPLSRDERFEMQRLLGARGLPVGTPDGIIGANTRSAIRSFQKSQKLPADGFASSSLLDRLRTAGSAS